MLRSAFAGEVDYVYRALRRHGVRAIDAEDLTQDVLLIAWRRRADFDQSRPLRPWLAGIAYRVAHEFHRRRPLEFLPDDVMEPLDPAPMPALEADALDARALVLRVLARMPERYRAVLVLHDLDGLSVADLAAALGVPRFTLYTRIRRARQVFASEVAKLNPGTGTGRRDAAAAVAPGALLELERDIPPAPAGLRHRVMENLRTEPTLGPVAPARPLPALKRLTPYGLPVATAGLAVVLGGLALWRFSPPGSPGPAEALALPSRGSRAAVTVSRPAPVRLAVRPPAPPALAAAWGLPAGLGRELIGFWRFDDGPGSTRAFDQSAAGNHCELRGLDPGKAWIAGVRGGAIELGFNGWLECPQPELPRRRTAGLTVAVWARRAGNPHNHHALATRSMGSGNYFFFGFDGDRLKVLSSGWGGPLTTRLADAPGRWVHLAFTHHPDHTVKLYVDGREAARRQTTPRVFNAVEYPLRIGAGVARTSTGRDRIGQLFEGAMDELLVYERALAGDEIRALAGLPP